MELPVALTIGLLAAGAAYSLLRPNLLRMVIGFSLLANAVNLTMIAAGGFSRRNAAPFVRDPELVGGLMDPLPPDIILTAIVISFAVGALFLFVMGGIYGGLFTATEGAGMGAFGALLFALGRRALTWRTLFDALLESARTTAMLFMILIGALMFAEFINITTMPADLKAFVTRFDVNPYVVMAAIAAIYVVLGTAMEELSMILLTMPVFFPVIVHLGFDPLWFGIIIVCVVEIGLISPPVGMNMFVLRTLLPEVSTGTVFSGVLPFMWADIVRLAILVAFPWISLWLPSLMR